MNMLVSRRCGPASVHTTYALRNKLGAVGIVCRAFFMCKHIFLGAKKCLCRRHFLHVVSYGSKNALMTGVELLIALNVPLAS